MPCLFDFENEGIGQSVIRKLSNDNGDVDYQPRFRCYLAKCEFSYYGQITLKVKVSVICQFVDIHR